MGDEMKKKSLFPGMIPVLVLSMAMLTGCSGKMDENNEGLESSPAVEATDDVEATDAVDVTPSDDTSEETDITPSAGGSDETTATDRSDGTDTKTADRTSVTENSTTDQNKDKNAGSVTMEKAKEIALKKAKLSEKDGSWTKEKVDKERGRTVYELEFVSGNTEYDFEIDAESGKILEYEKDSVHD